MSYKIDFYTGLMTGDWDFKVKHLEFIDFWLPAACGGAALNANITLLVVLMSFTQNLLLSLFSIMVYSVLPLISIALHQHCLSSVLLSTSVA